MSIGGGSVVLRQAVILAGGLGTRLGELTRKIPKPLLSVGGRPFLEYVVWNLRRYGITKLVFCVGYLADDIVSHFGDGSRFGVSIDYIVEQEPAGTGGALLLAKHRLDEMFLVLNGDTIFDINYFDLGLLMKNSKAAAVMALRSLQDTGRYGNVCLKRHLIKGFLEKASNGPGVVNGGVYVLRREVLESLPGAPCSLEKDLFPSLAQTECLAGRVYNGFFIDIGVPESLREGEILIPRWLKKPAAFLDRDGVLNVDKGYVHRIEDFVWIEGAPEAVKWLNDQGYLVFVVTNQAGIARGYYTEEEFLRFMDWINEELRQLGAHIDGVYYCPHHPEAGIRHYRFKCRCRKPFPGLLEQAMADWQINIEKSFLIGDKESDILAAQAAGIRGELFSEKNLLQFVRGVFCF